MSAKSPYSHPGIYLITNAVTGTSYVGQARNVRKRWEVHRSTLRSGNHRNCYLQRAWNKYGEGSFSFLVIRDFTGTDKDKLADVLNEAEITVLTSLLDTYNLMEAGLSGTTPSKATRELLSKQRKAMWANTDFRERRTLALRMLHADPEYRERRLEAVREGIRSPEARARRSEIMRAKWADPEFKAMMSAKHKEVWERESHREMQSTARAASWANPDSRARRIAGLKKAAKNPQVREARLAGLNAARGKIGDTQRENWKDTEYRARQIKAREKGQTKRFESDEERAKQSAAMKAVWARRKAAT